MKGNNEKGLKITNRRWKEDRKREREIELSKFGMQKQTTNIAKGRQRKTVIGLKEKTKGVGSKWGKRERDHIIWIGF